MNLKTEIETTETNHWLNKNFKMKKKHNISEL